MNGEETIGIFGGGTPALQLMKGDCIELMRQMEADTIGAVITDPPYASGGPKASDRCKGTNEKYARAKVAEYAKHNFDGDSMDQHSWMTFTVAWMREARRVCVNGAPFVVFTDWRQLPALTDAFQIAGLTWRGIMAWDKINARPQRGRPRQQAEFIVWGSNGDMPLDRNAPIIPGVLQCTAPSAAIRVHQTQKPVELLRTLVHICEPGGTILDPFAGSGTTLVAAQAEGYDAIGIEVNDYYAGVAQERLEIPTR